MSVPYDFTCPRCGGHTFGSSFLGDGSLERMCHGVLPSRYSCGFTWCASDDARYFSAEAQARWLRDSGVILGAKSP